MKTMDEILRDAQEIVIVSGEGTNGAPEEYTGTRTERAICAQLIKEECDGDRWAFVRVDGRRYDRDDYNLVERH